MRIKYINIICISLILLCCTPLQGQNINIVYKASNKVMNDMVDEEISLEYMTSLKLKNGKSVYSRDSLILKSEYPLSTQEFWTKKNIFKNYDEDLYIVESAEFKSGHLYESKISTYITKNAYEWEITNETETICDLICKKAISGFDTVWYSIKLPYSDGPHFGVFNLPGLVLKYKSLYGDWEATSVNYSNVDDIIIPQGQKHINKNNIKIPYSEIVKLSHRDIIIVNSQLEKNKYNAFRIR